MFASYQLNMESGKIDVEKVGNQFFFYKAKKYIVHPVEGLILNDEELIKRQRKMGYDLVTKLGMDLLKGENILKVSLPVGFFSKESLLERIAGEFSYAPIFLNRAASASTPLDRIKYCVAFSVSVLHLLIGQEKPFNPILGETVQRQCGDAMVYCEQISHHPPICRLLMTSPHYRVYGNFEYEVNVAPNSTSTRRKQVAVIEFNDGTKIEMSQPKMLVSGIMFGRRGLTYEDFITVKDTTNELYAIVKFNADDPGFFRRLLSMKRKRKDYLRGYITSSEVKSTPSHFDSSIRGKHILSSIEGYWIDYLKIDGEYFWKLDEAEPLPQIAPGDNFLPSDSTIFSEVFPHSVLNINRKY